jgi:hypothetical protein
MNARAEAVAKAHDKTFQWIFRDPKICHKPWDNFVSWLSYGSGIYWIQGKAASGKSTLMRFIRNNSMTHQNLQVWASGSEVMTSDFCFWNGGLEDQRSHVGLLRSLLYEILRYRKSLIPKVFSEEWERLYGLAAHDPGSRLTLDGWSFTWLQTALSNLIAEANPQLKFCFFIDGLDEYDGQAGDIAQYFKDLSLCSKYVKFCLSSRPWPEF